MLYLQYTYPPVLWYQYCIPTTAGIDESVSQQSAVTHILENMMIIDQQITCSGAVGSAVVSGALLKTYGSQQLDMNTIRIND